MAASLDNLYHKLPIPLQELAIDVYGLVNHRRRFNRSFYRLLEEKLLAEKKSADQIREERDARLVGFVQEAVRKVPYYRKLAESEGLAAEDLKSPEDVQQLPILDRESVQTCPEDFLNPDFPVRSLLKMHTSGTSGSGLSFWSTWDGWREQWAVWWRYRMMHGISFDTWQAYFGARQVVPQLQGYPPYWRTSNFSRQIFCSTNHVSDKTIDAFLDLLRRRQPPGYMGFRP